MTKQQVSGFVQIGIVLTGIGFICLYFNTSLGSSIADNWLMKQDGADTDLYLLRMASYVNTFLVSGAVMFGMGLFTLISTYFVRTVFPK